MFAAREPEEMLIEEVEAIWAAIADADEIDTSTAIYYRAALDVPNPDGTLRIGMTAEVTLVLAEAEDVSAAGLVAAALFLPVLVAVLVVAVVVGLWLLARRFRDRRTRGRAAAVPGGPEWTA